MFRPILHTSLLAGALGLIWAPVSGLSRITSIVSFPGGSNGDIVVNENGGFGARTLTAGSNVTITTSPTSITIAASVGGGGGATVNVSPNSVLYSTGGTTISGDNSFQYSGSSVTASGAIGSRERFEVSPSSYTFPVMSNQLKVYSQFSQNYFSSNDSKYNYIQSVNDQSDGDYANPANTGLIIYASTSTRERRGSDSSDATIQLSADPDCPFMDIYANGGTTPYNGSGFEASCDDIFFYNDSQLFGASIVADVYVLPYSTFTVRSINDDYGQIRISDGDGSGNQDGVILRGPADTVQDFVLVMPSTGGTVGQILGVDSMSNVNGTDIYNLAFQAVVASGGGSSSTTASVAYGSIYLTGSAVSQTNISSTPVKLTIFDTDGISSNTTVSNSSDRITVTSSGSYYVYGVVSSTSNYYTVGNTSLQQVNVQYNLRVNGSTTGYSCTSPPIEMPIIPGAGTTFGHLACDVSGIFSLNANDYVEFYVSASTNVPGAMSFTDGQLIVTSIGGSGGSGGGSSYTTKVEKFTGPSLTCAENLGCLNGNQYQTATSSWNYVSADFRDNATNYANVLISLPSDTGGPIYDGGTFTYQVVWVSTASAGTAAWKARAVYACNDDQIDTSRGTAIEITDAVTASGDWQYSAYSGALTPGGSYSAGCDLAFEVYREAFDSDDTVSGDLQLVKVHVKYGLTP